MIKRSGRGCGSSSCDTQRSAAAKMAPSVLFLLLPLRPKLMEPAIGSSPTRPRAKPVRVARSIARIRVIATRIPGWPLALGRVDLFRQLGLKCLIISCAMAGTTVIAAATRCASTSSKTSTRTPCAPMIG